MVKCFQSFDCVFPVRTESLVNNEFIFHLFVHISRFLQVLGFLQLLLACEVRTATDR